QEDGYKNDNEGETGDVGGRMSIKAIEDNAFVAIFLRNIFWHVHLLPSTHSENQFSLVIVVLDRLVHHNAYKDPLMTVSPENVQVSALTFPLREEIRLRQSSARKQVKGFAQNLFYILEAASELAVICSIASITM
ncbi:hypothetical protein KI387_020061, partial [Taxus chinensis]